MKNDSFCEKERKRIEKLNKFQLPSKWKKIGWIIFGVSIILLFARKLITEEVWLRFLLRHTIILGLLIVSLSKEKLEDEFIDKLRSQSYRLAFIIGVLYSLIQPHVENAVRFVLEKSPKDAIDAFSYFQVLILMLLIQVMFFEQLKRLNS
ncbi:MAG: hypothetical protein HWD82_08820 [Flavobacteriaceae bacterium]|nr:hypothetical protein [Flavobacteriaceae bacterium]